MLTSVCVEHADYVWITLAVFKIYKLLHFHYRTFIELKVDTIKRFRIAITVTCIFVVIL